MYDSPARITISSVAEQHQFYVDLLSPAVEERILDAGCGCGATLSCGLTRFPASSWHGVEYRSAPLGDCRRLAPEASLATADIRWLPYRDEVFDAVISRDTLECVPEPAEAVSEMSRVLKPGGYLLLCHWDWYSQTFHIGDLALARRLSDTFAETQQSWMEHIDPAMGRKLRSLVNLFRSLHVARAGIVTLRETEWREGAFGYSQSLAIKDLLTERRLLSQSDSGRWLSELDQASLAGSFAYSLDHYFVLARKAPRP